MKEAKQNPVVRRLHTNCMTLLRPACAWQLQIAHAWGCPPHRKAGSPPFRRPPPAANAFNAVHAQPQQQTRFNTKHSLASRYRVRCRQLMSWLLPDQQNQVTSWLRGTTKGWMLCFACPVKIHGLQAKHLKTCSTAWKLRSRRLCCSDSQVLALTASINCACVKMAKSDDVIWIGGLKSCRPKAHNRHCYILFISVCFITPCPLEECK